MYKFLEYKKSDGLTLKEQSEEKIKLGPDEALVEVYFSSINYKDALGVTGTAPIFKQDPIIPGIDLAGVCLTEPFKDQKVLVHGGGLGEDHDGGYSQLCKAKVDHLIPLPQGLSFEEAMALGTAGFTAALAFYRMEINGQTPDKGPILISGATGGVGGFATQIFSQSEYEVHAVTHRMEFLDQLKSLGATEVHSYDSLFPSDKKTRPLERVEWGGVIDNLGGDFLEKTLPAVALWGNVASIGLAKNSQFSTTVMPFILRGVSLLGASSNNCPQSLRQELWSRLSEDLKPNKITELVEQTVDLNGVLSCAKKIMAHEFKGRALVDLKK